METKAFLIHRSMSACITVVPQILILLYQIEQKERSNIYIKPQFLQWGIGILRLFYTWCLACDEL